MDKRTGYEKIKNRRDLAQLMGVRLSDLTYVLYKEGIASFYHSFEIPKKDGTCRQIDASEKQLKTIQKRLATLLWRRQLEIWNDKDINPNVSHAFQKRKSIFTNAKIHKAKRFVLNTDLEDFFGTINFGRVKGFFEKNRDFCLPEDVALCIAQLACYNGRLPQGAPSSPIITNLIANIMDMRIIKLAKKYKLDYSRYADDLTFSTNSGAFLAQKDEFYEELSREIIRAGFIINEKKTRFSFRESRQIVTGLIVNDKISVPIDYRKNTRAMLHHLYKDGEFFVNGNKGTINQLEGRLSFIDQVDFFNRRYGDTRSRSLDFNSRECEYKKFKAYRLFLAGEKPLVITEGDSDVLHLKAAIRSNDISFPKLVEQNSEGTVAYNISFLNMSRKTEHFLDIADGGGKFANIAGYYGIGTRKPCLCEWFLGYTKCYPNFPVIMIVDNEEGNSPLSIMLNKLSKHDKKAFEKSKMKEILNRRGFIRIIDNLYLLTYPRQEHCDRVEIENLYEISFLRGLVIHGKKYVEMFEKNPQYDYSLHFSKMEFANYIATERHYEKIDYSMFSSTVKSLIDVIDDYNQYINDNDYIRHLELPERKHDLSQD